MFLNPKKKNYQSVEEIFEKYFDLNMLESECPLFFLYIIIDYFRPPNPEKVTTVSIAELNGFLSENESVRIDFIQYLSQIFSNKRARRVIADSGSIKESNFLREVYKRFTANWLPEQPPKQSVGYILNQVFYKRNDYEWVRKISFEELFTLFNLIEVKPMYGSITGNSLLSEMLYAMHLITQRICGKVMETEVLKMVPEYDNLESPFIAFERERNIIEQKIRISEEHYINSQDIDYKQLQILHSQCYDFIDKAFKNSSRFGISLKVNQSLLTIKQQLERLQALTRYLIVEKEEDKKLNTIKMMMRLVKYNGYKNNFRELIDGSTQLVAYEITQHSAKTGEHYITSSSKEYYDMLKSAAGGGFVVGILCIIKLLLSQIQGSELGHGVLYSLNYAIGFVIIYLLGFTLATKQPAMTAATLAKALELGLKNSVKNVENYQRFAALFARLFRSQFISFVGNVLMAFPVALIGVYLIKLITGVNIAETQYQKLLTDLSPIHSLLIFHAAIAGVFLFLSGIISGDVANRNKYNQVYYRIEEHPLLKITFGREKTRKIATWFENKWPAVIANIYFGFFMGMTGSIGHFIGLPLDIRHITFASGNLALSLFGSHFIIDPKMLFLAIIGIFLIGFVNFIVSFTLSISLAFRSRNIPLSEVSWVNKAVWVYFKKHPLRFFFPV